MQHTRLLIGAFALTAIGAGVAGCRPLDAAAAHHASTDPASGMSSSSAAAMAGHGSGAGRRPAPPGIGRGSGGSGMGSGMGSGGGSGVSLGNGRYLLAPMPAGTVSIARTADGRLRARVDMFGLTPGSAHQVSINGPFGRSVAFPNLTADATGRADSTLTSLTPAGRGAGPGRFVVRLGDTPSDPLAAEPIADAVVVPGRTFTLHAVGPGGVGHGRLGGHATIGYDPAAKTLSVTVTAYGLNPGPHAAHIHLGSCQNQGPVNYPLADFTADARGDIVNQTRTVTGVPSISTTGGWYLNLHQGGMNQILSGGMPTLYFRPLLCTDVTSIATTEPTATSTPSTPAASSPAPSMPTETPTTPTMPTETPTTPAMPTMPTETATPTMPTTASTTPSASDSPSPTPPDRPTHW